MHRSYLLIAFLLLGCSEAAQDTHTIKVTFVASTDDVRRRCGDSPLEPYGCAIQNRSSINPKGACEIVAVKPRGFDDHAAVETLGHELLHCLWGPVHR